MRKTKRFLAMTLAVTTMMASSAFADSALPEPATITGTNPAVVTPTYSITAPTEGSLALTIDPMKVNKKTQIYSAEATITNASNVPVYFSAEIELTAAGGAVLATSDEIAKLSPDDTTKKANVVMQFKQAGATAEADKYVDDISIGTSTALKKAAFGAALDATGGEGKKAITYQFTGDLTSAANWANTDLVLNMTYKFVGMTADRYEVAVKDAVASADGLIIANGANTGKVDVDVTAVTTAGKASTYGNANDVVLSTTYKTKPTKFAYTFAATEEDIKAPTAAPTAATTTTLTATFSTTAPYKATINAAAWATAMKTINKDANNTDGTFYVAIVGVTGTGATAKTVGSVEYVKVNLTHKATS